MTNRTIGLIWASVLGVSVAACSGETQTDAADNGDAATSTEAGSGQSADASDGQAEHPGYVTDETGMLSETIGPEAMANITERLASNHSQTGSDIQVLIIDSTNGGDKDAAASAARAERNADALIFIAAGDQQIAVVGENIDAQEGAATAEAITTAFDNDNFENGLLNGITATAGHMED